VRGGACGGGLGGKAAEGEHEEKRGRIVATCAECNLEAAAKANTYARPSPEGCSQETRGVSAPPSTRVRGAVGRRDDGSGHSPPQVAHVLRQV